MLHHLQQQQQHLPTAAAVAAAPTYYNMGKSRKKKATIDYDELFKSEPKKSEDDWFCGLSALMLEDDPSRPLKVLPSAAGSAAAEDGMDTADVLPSARKKRRQKQRGLQLQSASLKNGRGNRTAAQKKRKAGKTEKALARAEKAAVKVNRKVSKKQQVAALKALY